MSYLKDEVALYPVQVSVPVQLDLDLFALFLDSFLDISDEMDGYDQSRAQSDEAWYKQVLVRSGRAFGEGVVGDQVEILRQGDPQNNYNKTGDVSINYISSEDNRGEQDVE